MGLCAFVRFCRMWISDGGDLYGILNRRVYAHGWELKSTLPDESKGGGSSVPEGSAGQVARAFLITYFPHRTYSTAVTVQGFVCVRVSPVAGSLINRGS